MTYTIHIGDSLEVMPSIESNSVDSVVTDPPYGLNFMSKNWDYGVPGVEFWKECLRIAKPGAHLLAFGGDRTHHRLMVAIEDAGWEIRTCIYWVYGQGFPKSLDVGKQLASKSEDLSNQWHGWGTGLKPAAEIITVARKPLVGTVADNIFEYGVGAININATRIPVTDGAILGRHNKVGNNGWKNSSGGDTRATYDPIAASGRWPANLIIDDSDEVLSLFPVNKLSHARFFYCSKASKSDKDEGLDAPNTHVTVKPTDLMRYLCKLVTPPNGLILDPFMGSGSTGKAAILEGFRFKGIEINPEYAEIAEKRINYALHHV